MTAPLLMIPGPIELSDAVKRAAASAPPSHVDPHFIEVFGKALDDMLHVWQAGADATPFAVAGGGTLAMEAAVTNLLDPGELALVVNTGYFGDRMTEMLSRRGVEVHSLTCEPGSAPTPADLDRYLNERPHDFKAVFVTHVDTSTGVRADAQGFATVAASHGVLSIFDGVCATAGEGFFMEEWGADVYLTASQKAVGLPPGLALWVASPKAMEARSKLSTPPPMTMDWLVWAPIMAAYRARKPSYFSTPATSLGLALGASFDEMLSESASPSEGMTERFAQHERAADGMRAAWKALGLQLLPQPGLEANTLSALYYPEGVDSGLLPLIKANGAIVAGGLHKALKTQYFRVGHMGVVTNQPDALRATISAVAKGLCEYGHLCDESAALAAFDTHFTSLPTA